VVHKIPSVEGNLFTFGLICYFCPGSQKIKIMTSKYKWISNKQGVRTEEMLVRLVNKNLLVICQYGDNPKQPSSY
jgi:hypothetical protein